MTTSAIIPEQFIFAHHHELKTTSLKIAEAFDKRHADVLRSIEEIITQVSDSFNKRNFALIEVDVKVGFGIRKDPAYELTKNGFVMVVMSFTGQKAMQIKEAYINAFDFMYNKLFPITSQAAPTDLPDFLKPVTDPISYETYTERRDLLTHHLALLKKAPVNITVSAETADGIKAPPQAQADLPCVDENLNEAIVSRQAFEVALARFLDAKKTSGSQAGSIKALRCRYRKEFIETGKMPRVFKEETRGRHSRLSDAVVARFEALIVQSADPANQETFIPWSQRKVTLLHSILEDEFKQDIPILSLYRIVNHNKALKLHFKNDKVGV